MKIVNIIGARPNFMKIAPLMAAYGAYPAIEPLLVHTGQHYDERMSDLFFRQLGIPQPDVNLGIGSGSHAVQTAEVMKAFEPVVLAHKPDAVFLASDTMALSAIQAIQEHGLRVSEDIAVVCFDDIPQACRSITALTTVRQPITRSGAVAAETLIGMIETGSTLPRQMVFAGRTHYP